VGCARAQPPAGERASGTEADDVGNVLGARAQAVLVARAVDQRVKRGARADIERADALGGIELVAGHGEQVHAELVDVDRHLAH
jgi:hypothetical protein